MSKKRYITWDEIVHQCSDICDLIKNEDHLQVCNIIGISRGGLIPAVLIAQMLDVRNVYSIGLKSYDSDGHRNSTSELYQELDKNTIKMINECEGSTLIVDDISDQGKTLIDITTQYKLNNCRCASLFVKTHTHFIPRYHGDVVHEWIVFPWELNNTV